MKGLSNARPSSCVRAVALPNAAALHVDGRDRAPRPGVDSNAPAAVPFTFFPAASSSRWTQERMVRTPECLWAYGLVYGCSATTCRYWVINPAKPRERRRLYDRRRFTAGRQDRRAYRGPVLSRRTLRHRRRERRGGTSIVQAWQAAAGDATAVHRLTSGSFMPDIRAARWGASDRHPEGRQRGDRVQRAERRRHSRMRSAAPGRLPHRIC